MPTTQQLRERLLKKLKELFQLDQPDLDFGFYRIMHAKSGQITDFIDKDLLKIIAGAFGQVDDSRKSELFSEYEKAKETARDFGAPDPENVPKVQEAKAKYEQYKDSVSAEGEIYDHLYRFFERYYDEGDFISRRYHTRETPGKAAPFAIPYNGEEVKLHWANADQYYIKTTDYFSNFTIDLMQSKEIAEKKDGLLKDESDSLPESLKVHFRIIDASEGEHGNVKESEANKRFFIIFKDKPIEFNVKGELIINFEYRPDTEKTGQEGPWRERKNSEAVEVILNREIHETHEKELFDKYIEYLSYPAPTEKDKNRPLIAKYINQYTGRNTMDYFIHKDLGGFLRRELDFYIKNEIMRLDDIENADAPAVEGYLAKIKVIRKIANKLIDFMAQLEDFQKKLWLKKKFVVETNYCITLDRVPEVFYPEIAANDAQYEKWVKLGFIDTDAEKTEKKKEPDLFSFAENVNHETHEIHERSVSWLKENPCLVLDTKFFTDDFKSRLIASIENFDEQMDGLLIHSENFQALNLLQERYKEQVDHIYTDPPYNAKSSEIIYKNDYKHSSWVSLISSRMIITKNMINRNGTITIAIDENENLNLGMILKQIFPEYINTCVTIIHNPGGIQGKNFSYTHEYAYFIHPPNGVFIGTVKRSDTGATPLRDWGGDESRRESAANCFYPIFVNNGEIIDFGEVCDDNFHPKNAVEISEDGSLIIYPIDNNGIERKWRFAKDTVESILDELKCEKINGEWTIRRYKTDYRFKTVWTDKKYNANTKGSKILNDILGGKYFDFPKSLYTVQDSIIAVIQQKERPLVMDIFAGSGTTAHAIIDMKRKSYGDRKYILIEQGAHFYTSLFPRIIKCIFSDSWRKGKPLSYKSGVSHCFKYLRLESFEDTLNNLVFDKNEARGRAIADNPSLKEDYILNYMLDVETKGSRSILNIDSFSNPENYSMKIKKSGSDEYEMKNIDLIETFNYLIGLRVDHIAAPQEYKAKFKREIDKEVPDGQKTKLILDGAMKEIVNHETIENPQSKIENSTWRFRKIEGWVPKDRSNPNNGLKEKVLIVWRRLTGNIEEDNLMLDEWFNKNRINTRDFEFDTIYVNCSNNLPNLKIEGDKWKVALIEEEFMKRMWDMEGV